MCKSAIAVPDRSEPEPEELQLEPAATKGSKAKLWIGLGVGGAALIVLIVVLAVVGRKGGDAAPTAKLSPEENYKQLLPSTAWVLIKDGNRIGSGSGVLIHEGERLVLTNYHVVEGAQRAVVFFPAYRDSTLETLPQRYIDDAQARGLPGTVVDRDSKRDLALIQLDKPATAPAVVIANRSAEPGQNLHSIGASGVNLRSGEGALWRLTSGPVRQVYEQSLRYDNGQIVSAWTVETQAPTNRGDSGGPVVNDFGQLVALVSGGSNVERLVSINIDVREIRTYLRDYFRRIDKPWIDLELETDVTPTPQPGKTSPVAPKPRDLASLIKDLESADAETRSQAIRALTKLEGAARSALPDLLKLLKDPDQAIRQLVRTAIQKIGVPSAAERPAYVRALSDSDREIRLFALRELLAGEAPDRATVAAAARLIRDRDIDIRRAAIALLRKGANPDRLSVMSNLTEALGDEDIQVAQAAAEQVAQLGRDGISAFRPLVEALGHPSASVRTAIFQALEAIGTPRAEDIPTLRACLRHKLPEARVFAAKTVGKLGTSGAAFVEELADRLNPAEPETVRVAAAEALRGLGKAAEPAAKAILKATDDSSIAVRTQCAEILGTLGRMPGSLPALIKALGSTEASLQQAAETSLKALGPFGKSELPILLDCLKSESSAVRRFAVSWIEPLGPDAKEATPLLERWLSPENATADRYRAIKALKSIGSKNEFALAQYRKILQEKGAAKNAAVADGTPENPTPGMLKLTVAEVFEQLGAAAAEAVPDLRVALDLASGSAPDPALRGQLAKTLGAIGPKAEAAGFELLVCSTHEDSREQAHDAMRKIGKGLTKLYVEELKNRTPTIRLAAIRALGAVGSDEANAINRLSEITANRRELDVARTAANESIEKIRRGKKKG